MYSKKRITIAALIGLTLIMTYSSISSIMYEVRSPIAMAPDEPAVVRELKAREGTADSSLGDLEGMVYINGEVPLTFGTVIAYDEHTQAIASCRIQRNGLYHLEGLPLGEVRLAVTTSDRTEISPDRGRAGGKAKSRQPRKPKAKKKPVGDGKGEIVRMPDPTGERMFQISPATMPSPKTDSANHTLVQRTEEEQKMRDFFEKNEINRIDFINLVQKKYGNVQSAKVLKVEIVSGTNMYDIKMELTETP